MSQQSERKIAAVRVRGTTGIKSDIKDTLNMLRLYRTNYCVVLDDTPNVRGMLKKVKDYVTYGEIDEATFREIVEKRGEPYRGRTASSRDKIRYNKFIEVDSRKIKPYFRLNPPRKGLGRKGIRAGFAQGGALGYRGEKIAELLQRML